MALRLTASSSSKAVLTALMRSLPHARCPWHGAGCASASHSTRGVSSPSSSSQLSTDFAFEMAASNIRFGSGCTEEVGDDAVAMGMRRVMLFTDKNLLALGASGPVGRVQAALARKVREGKLQSVSLFSDVAIEPTDTSFQHAAEEAKRVGPDGFIAVGGGSVMDTAKAANLYSAFPTAPFLDFVNAPIGKGLPVPQGRIKPLIAVPTTAGTGSEVTGVAIFDHTPTKAKTGIASRHLKPSLGLVDPDNTLTMPKEVAVASGFDVLCHALESYTAIPFNQRSPRPSSPQLRPAYQGANPISDVWSLHSLRLLARYFLRSCEGRGQDREANEAMALAATYAGVGFGNAGVHLAHGCSYAISGLNKGYVHPGYGTSGGGGKSAIVPHGISVVLTAPAIFARTAVVSPDRHDEAARILAGENPPVSVAMYRGAAKGDQDAPLPSHVRAEDAGKRLADQLRRYMLATGVPDGLQALGYGDEDVPALVSATLPQRRVLDLAPSRDHVGEDALGEIFRGSMKVY